jgi:hypothetical protein
MSVQVQGSSRQSKAEVQAEKNWLSLTCHSILEIFGIFGILEIHLEILNLKADLYICGGLCSFGFQFHVFTEIWLLVYTAILRAATGIPLSHALGTN